MVMRFIYSLLSLVQLYNHIFELGAYFWPVKTYVLLSLIPMFTPVYTHYKHIYVVPKMTQPASVYLKVSSSYGAPAD